MGDPDGWIGLVLRRAAELRAAGVLSIAVDGCSVTLAESAPLPFTGDIDKPDVDDDIGDPLHDPASYPGGVVPGFEINRFVREED